MAEEKVDKEKYNKIKKEFYEALDVAALEE